MKKQTLVRYVPSQNGSPAWMSPDAADRLLVQDSRTVDLLRACGVKVDYPHIEYSKAK